MKIRNFGFRRDGRQHAVVSRAARIEKRADKPPLIEGYASVFYDAKDEEGTTYWIWSDVQERIGPTCFDRAMKDKHDVRALVNHDWDNIVGRTAAGSLELAVDNVGLKYSFEHDPQLQASQNLLRCLEKGLYDGSSFGFVATRVSWTEMKTDQGWIYIRTIEDCDLIEVSVVGLPAYTGTSAGVRSFDGRAIQNESLYQELMAERSKFFSGRVSEMDVQVALRKLDTLGV